MGRRAKNKQGDPEPFAEVQENRPSQKKLGKRKADEVDAPAKRPAKKARDIDGRPSKSVKTVASKGKEKGVPKDTAKAKPAKAQAQKKQQVQFEDEDEGAGSSEGWEDVEDNEDIKVQAKCVPMY